MSAASDAIDILTRQYYNAVVAGLGVSSKQFQLGQGSISLGTTSTLIWAKFDSLPPAALNNYFNSSEWNSFGSTYGAVINNLVPQDSGAMASLLGDDYLSWTQYKTLPPDTLPTTPDGLLNFAQIKKIQFQRWALQNGISNETVIAGIGILSQVDFISAAAVKWQAASKQGVFAYTATQQGLKNAIDGGQSKTVNLDSSTESTDTSHSWASGQVSGGYGFFSASVSASWDKFSQDIQKSGVKLNIKFEKVATLSGGPLLTVNQLDTDLSKYLPWYDSKAIQTAYTENNNTVWKRTAPTWEGTFGSNGNLKNLTVALIVVDGITTTTTTTASVSKTDQESFKAAAQAGYWPFFQASGQGGWTTEVTFNDKGEVTVTSSSKTGNPNVIGVLVSPFKDAFKG
jgi:hypothetical protein